MGGTTGKAATVFVLRRTATTNMLTVVTPVDLATRTNTSRFIAKATNRAISRDTTAAVMAGATKLGLLKNGSAKKKTRGDEGGALRRASFLFHNEFRGLKLFPLVARQLGIKMFFLGIAYTEISNQLPLAGNSQIRRKFLGIEN